MLFLDLLRKNYDAVINRERQQSTHCLAISQFWCSVVNWLTRIWGSDLPQEMVDLEGTCARHIRRIAPAGRMVRHSFGSHFQALSRYMGKLQAVSYTCRKS